MAARPSSPTSLLWAHQLKREHGYLLKRVQKLESENEKHDDRIKSAENAARSSTSGDIESLAQQVKAMEDSGVTQRVTDMEANVTRKLDDVEAESEAMTMQIAALQKDDAVTKAEREKALTKEKALLRRISDVEQGLKKYEQTLDRIGRQVNDDRLQQIKDQLENLAKQVKKEGSQMKLLEESVKVLEDANRELQKANEKLEADLKRVADQSAANESAKAATSTSPDEADATSGAQQESSKKKSHKWVGGGADRDIIQKGSVMFGSQIEAAASTQTSAPPAKKKPPPPPPKPKKKPLPPKKGLFTSNADSSSPKKSHRWAGGGADKDIIQAGISLDSKASRKRSRSVGDIAVPPKKRPQNRLSGGDTVKNAVRTGPSTDPKPKPQKATPAPKPAQAAWAKDGVAKKDVVRAGKGWYEIADEPIEEPQTSSEPVKRPRGRPRKNPTPQLDPDLLTQGRVTRHGKQPAQTKSGLGKRKARAVSESSDDLSSPERPAKKSKSTAETTKVPPKEEEDESMIFESPQSSPTPEDPADQLTTTANEPKNELPGYAAYNPQPTSSEPPKRRIVNPDDMGTFMKYWSR